MSRFSDCVRNLASACVQPLVRCAARGYVAGALAEDAMRVARRLHDRGYGITLGYWDGVQDNPAGVSAKYLHDLKLLADSGFDAYESIKLPGLGMSTQRALEVLEAGRERGIRVHFDALWIGTADATWDLIELAAIRGHSTSGTLPGRWSRSVRDAERACELNVPVRVVKGQSPDPGDAAHDPRQGYIDVVRTLAGRATHVAVATHDVGLAEASLELLQAAGTPCDLELLFGLPWRDVSAVAKRRGVKVRFYVPYGEAYLPYCLSQASRHPVVLWRLMKDSWRGMLGSSDTALSPDAVAAG